MVHDVTCALNWRDVYMPKLMKDIGIVKSSNEGRRLIEQNAVKINLKIIRYNSDIWHGDILTIGKRRIYELVSPRRMTATDV